ncbi:glycosyltransferase family 2 protein [Spirosoma migulaei]
MKCDDTKQITTYERIAGTVILYNSNFDVIDNINTYMDQVEVLYVVDNSDSLNKELINTLQQFEKIIYYSNNGNRGIACALNIAANLAICDGFSYLLTMDDDTSVPQNMINVMLSFLKNHKKDNIALIAPQHIPNLVENSYTNVYFVITSGSLLDLNAYLQCGPFLEELFIDWVDHEYCMRLKKHNFSIIELNYLSINHRLGNRKEISLLGVSVFWTSHNPIRIYYKIRNTLYVLTKYRKIIPIGYLIIFAKDFTKEIVKNLTFENNKKYRAFLLYRAFCDYWQNRMGPFK